MDVLKAVAKSCAMRRLEGFMRAGDIMTRNVVSVSPETSASRVVTLCLTQGTSGLPVVDRDRRVVGMIGQGNLVTGSQESIERRALWLHLLSAGMSGRG